MVGVQSRQDRLARRVQLGGCSHPGQPVIETDFKCGDLVRHPDDATYYADKQRNHGGGDDRFHASPSSLDVSQRLATGTVSAATSRRRSAVTRYAHRCRFSDSLRFPSDRPPSTRFPYDTIGGRVVGRQRFPGARQRRQAPEWTRNRYDPMRTPYRRSADQVLA
jgi:hypothetical protein